MSNPNTADPLPWVCPDHPQAMIRHSWNRSHYVMNGYPAGTSIDSNHRYECADCGRQLAACMGHTEAGEGPQR